VIPEFEPTYRVTDSHFRQAKAIIGRSRVAETINGYHRDKNQGGQQADGISYTLSAVLVSALSLMMLGCMPSVIAILRVIGSLSPRQLAEVGMAGEDTSRIFAVGAEQRREYRRFSAWLERTLLPLDSAPDQPAKRIPNAEHDRIIRRRTPQQQAAYDLAAERLRTVINDLVAGSILHKQPDGACGDIVADETIYDLAGPSAGLGIKPDKHRGACYFGRYYARDGRSGPLSPDRRAAGKHGFGVGITAVTRIGPPDQLHAIPPVVVGIDIHEPTSGSPQGLRNSIEHMKRNGLDTRPGHGRTWPLLTVDMGYNPKDDFAPLMIEHEYTPVVRYPRDWPLAEVSANPPGSPDTQPLPGPVQYAGAFYCPAAEEVLRNHTVPKSRELLASNGWAGHDTRLSNTLPFLMGTNSRPIVNRKRGRPRLGAPAEHQVKFELVCPAVQLRVRCPLKPASMTQAGFGVPLATPSWTAEERRCCKQSTIRVTLTDRQVKKAQWGLVAGTWEHMIHFEATRALTEQRFALLKSPYLTGMTEVAGGPRREPLVKILLALAVAATNHQIQKTHKARSVREESVDVRWRQLGHHLGGEPTRTPPRT
jgi:hypothetical protein